MIPNTCCTNATALYLVFNIYLVVFIISWYLFDRRAMRLERIQTIAEAASALVYILGQYHKQGTALFRVEHACYRLVFRIVRCGIITSTCHECMDESYVMRKKEGRTQRHDEEAAPLYRNLVHNTCKVGLIVFSKGSRGSCIIPGGRLWGSSLAPVRISYRKRRSMPSSLFKTYCVGKQPSMKVDGQRGG